MQPQPEIKYTIPLNGIKFSTNKIYAGIHWTKRKEIKDSISSYVFAFCRPVKRVKSYPVEIEYKFLFGTKPLDSLNTAAMAKMFEDAFRAAGILEDDDPRYVKRSILEVNVVPKEEGQKKLSAQRKQANAKNEDSVTISIYETQSNN